MNNLSMIERLRRRRTVRSYDQSAVTHEQLMHVFEAARWVPSSYHAQPWRYVYALRDENDHAWQKLLKILVPANREWAQYAGALIIIGAAQTAEFRGNKLKNIAASFDVGASTLAMTLQAQEMGLSVAVVGGLDYQEAATLLDDDVVPLAMMILGKQPAGEHAPAAPGRKDIADFARAAK